MWSQTELSGFTNLSDCCSAEWSTNEALPPLSPGLGNTCQTSTCFEVETRDTLEPNSPGAMGDKKHTRLASFLFAVTLLCLRFCASAENAEGVLWSFFREVETVSSLLEGKHKQRCIFTPDCTYREHPENIREGQS